MKAFRGLVRGRRSGRRKRIFDLAVGSVLAAAALPLIAVLAIGVAVSLRTWPFFIHDRVGGHGARFRVPKLRTLPTHVPAYADKYAIAAVGVPRFALFLRRTHLDELPQLLLVPLGAMSLVGPRPEMPHLHLSGEPAFATLRTSIRPGCTGLWQVSQDADKLIWESPQYDRFYLDHATIRLDLWILWRSALLLAGVGSRIDLASVPGWLRGREGRWAESSGRAGRQGVGRALAQSGR